MSNRPATWLASGRIPALDGLRAVAIFFVIISHVRRTHGFPEVGPFTRALAPFGTLGVDIFFVLSGFLITTLLCREVERANRVHLGAFYVRRIFRLAPAFVCFLAAVAALQLCSLVDISGRDWLAAVTYTMNFRSKPAWELGHLWSLSIEEHFYLLWPPVFAFVSYKLGTRILLATLLIQPAIRWGVLLFRPELSPMTDLWTFTRFDTIAAGSLLAILSRDETSCAQLDRISRYWAFALASLIAGLALGTVSGKFAVGVTPSITAVTIAILVWTAARRAPKFLEHPWIAAIGVGSYSLYLWQQLFLNPHQTYWWTTFPQNLALPIIATWISFRFIEKPFLKLKQQLQQKKAPHNRTHETPDTSPVGIVNMQK